MWFERRPKSRIFINYRRDDARGIAGRLDDSLSAYFGDDRVFRDVDDIEGGADFEAVLQETVSAADAAIVLIGPNWLTISNESGQRRLDDPEDWVVREIAAALDRQLPVFPVLVEDTAMPRAEDLPDAIKSLAKRNAISLSDRRWSTDVIRLAKIVALDISGSVAERQLQWVQVAVAIVLFGAVSFTAAIAARDLSTFAATHSVRSDPTQAEDLASGIAAGELRCPTSTPLQPAYVLTPAKSAVTYFAIAIAVILLLVSAPLVEASKRKYLYASVLLGVLGTTSCLIVNLFVNSCDEGYELRQEAIVLFFGSTTIATGMFALMLQSGFKPK